MNECPDISCSGNDLSAGCLRQLLDARLTCEFSDDQLVEAIRGSYAKNEFFEAVSLQLQAIPESTPRVMALVNRLNKRGVIPADLVRSLESKFGRIEVGRLLRDRYVIEQRLGKGGKGTVFKALDRYRAALPAPRQYVAIKVLQEFPGGDLDESIGALQQELQSAQALSHPNIVKVYDFDRDGDIDFFTMEFLEGELLSSLLQRLQPLPIARPYAWSIIRQIASGLAHAHERNVVHGDLKPENIMITNSGEVRILDFGVSRFAAQGHEPAGRIASSATPAYASCELLDGRRPDPRDDLYALACISYELLTGAHPFQRRRASEARAFGVVPTRPSGLRGRQWRTLAKGLSWHRAGRSILVDDWFKGLKPAPDPAPRLASLADLKPAPVIVTRPRSPFGASAVFSLLITAAAIWMLFVRVSPEGEAIPSAAVNAPSANAAQSSFQSSFQASASNGASLFSDMAPSAASIPQLLPEGPVNLDLKSTDALATSRGVTILPGDYQVQPGQHFAEIRVHRSSNRHGDAPLVWWTEAASAKPGVDYVSQAKVTQSFPKGRDSMSIFVKLLPGATRTQRQVFYIAVADKDDKHVGQITHTAVHLPSTRTSS